MEILKGFSFDIQRFSAGAYTLAAGTVVASENIAKLYSDADGSGVVSTTASAYEVGSVVNGVLQWTHADGDATADDTLTITTGAASKLKSVALSGSGTLGSVSFLTSAGNGVTATAANLSGVSMSGAAITVTGVPVTKAADMDDPVTFKNGASWSDGTDGFTVGSSSTVTALYNTHPTVTLTTGNTVDATKGDVYISGAGTVNLAKGVNVTGAQTDGTTGGAVITGDASESAVLTAAGNGAAVSTFTLNSGKIASIGTAGISIGTTGTTTATVGSVVFGGNGSMTADLAVGGAISNASNGSKIEGVAANVTVGTKLQNNETITLNGTLYTQSGATSIGLTSFGPTNGGVLTTGSVLVTTVGNSVYAGTNTTAANYDKVTYVAGGTTNDGVIVTGGTVNTSITLKDLDAGESISVSNGSTPTKVVTYSAIDEYTLGIVDENGAETYYRTSSSLNGATITIRDTGTGLATGDVTGAGTVSTVMSGIVKVSGVTQTTYFTAAGYGLSKKTSSTVATVEVDSSSTKKVTVEGTLTNGVDLSGTTASVTDKGTTTDYTLAAGSIVKATGAAFTATDGVVSNVTGTNAFALQATSTTFKASGTVNVDASAASATTPTITYTTGNDINNAKVTIGANKYFTLTETNTGDSAVNTVIDLNTDHITGLDGDATITTSGINSGDISDITTTGSGTFTLNKTAYVVANDDNGVTFYFDTTTPTPVDDEIDAVTGLDQDATITVAKLSNAELSVNGTKFTAITAKNNIVFTGSKADKSAATATVFTKGDTVTDASGNVYTVEAMGSNSDGIVITAGKITALNDGDKIKVDGTTTGSYTVYEVSGKLLVESVYTSASTTPTTTTYEINDADDPGFTISSITAGTGVGTIDNGKAGKTGQVVTFGTGTDTTTSTTLTDGMYITAEGTAAATEKGSVAKVAITDDAITYTSTSSKSQVVNVATTSDNWSITTAAGKDTISMTAGVDATIDSGAGDDVITLGGKGDKVVNTGDGKNTVNLGGDGDITLTLGNGKDAVSYAAAGNGDLVINATGGNNDIDLSKKGTRGDVTITGGSGNDTITASSADNVVSGGDGKDTFKVGSGITISDYSFENDVIFTNGAFSVTDDGKISVSGGKADISANAGDFYTAQIVTATGNKAQNWAWAKDGGSNIDITTYTKNAYLAGDDDGTNQLYAGSGDDHIYSYSDGDSVYGGAGKNTISLGSGKEKRVVGVSVAAKGKDTITGFKASFEDEGDSFFLVDGNLSDTTLTVDTVSGSSANLTMKNGSASVSLVGAGVNTVTGAVEIKTGSSKIAAINKGAVATISDANYADAYIGSDSAVNFSGVDGDLSLDLSNNLTASGNGPKFVGIASVVGGAGSNTIIGSAKADSIVAGTGKSSLYGGAGADILVGNGETDMFFFGNSSGTDTITSFQAAGVDNADTVKVLGDITSAKLNGSKIELGTADGSKAVINSLATGSINANTMVKVEADNFIGTAKLGESSKANNFTYDKAVGYYGGGSASDKISVSSSFSDNAEVWLDGNHGTAYSSIDVVDFTNGTGNYILAGDSSKNTIVGGKGENSLWGGAGNVADTIKGGAGTNTFFWGIGEGNDSISSSKAEDTVNLYSVKLADVDLANTEITTSGVVLALNDGSKLTVQTSRDINFTVDGTSWTAVHNTKEWKQNS